MKVLIWIACLLVLAVLNTWVGNAISFGYADPLKAAGAVWVATVALAIGTFVVARKLCKKYDEWKQKRTAKKKRIEELIKINEHNAKLIRQLRERIKELEESEKENPKNKEARVLVELENGESVWVPVSALLTMGHESSYNPERTERLKKLVMKKIHGDNWDEKTGE